MSTIPISLNNPYWGLKFPTSGAGYALNKLLNEKHPGWLPGVDKVLLPLELINPSDVKVAIFGQDPYPNSDHVTGIPFEVPYNIDWMKYPSTLQNIFREYASDLKYPYPYTASLVKWFEQGVFLWNVIPTCDPGVSLSHEYMTLLYYEALNKEIIETIQNKNKDTTIFVFLGAKARRYKEYVWEENDDNIIELSHPSPRGAFSGKHPFRHSRLFTTINAKLIANGVSPIDWKLCDVGPFGESHAPVIETSTTSSANPHIPPSKDVWREEWELIKHADFSQIESKANERNTNDS